VLYVRVTNVVDRGMGSDRRMTTPPNADHVDVAAYVLGILDAPDEAAFTQHFARCQRCRTEYRELSDLPMLLDQLKPAHQPAQQSERSARRLQPVAAAVPGKRVLGQALDRVTEARQRRNRMLWLAAAAVIVTLVAVPLIVLRSTGKPVQVAGPTVTVSAAPSTTDTPQTGTDVVAGAHTVKGNDATSGVSATIGIEPQSWGTRVNLELRSPGGRLQCQLVAVNKAGDTQVVTSWQVPAGGIGVNGAPTSEPLRLQGGVGFNSDDISRFEVRTADGPILLRIQA
jgi:hypothetical protein